MTDETQQQGGQLERREAKPPAPLFNGVMAPDRWEMFGRIATTVADTDFVPKQLRGKPPAVMACLLYGDSLGLHPSVSLTDVYVTDGKPGISGALMMAKILEAGHRVQFERIVVEGQNDPKYGDFVGWRCVGQRLGRDGEVELEDEWTYTMADAKAAALYPNSNPRAAWMKIPEVMCRWRALAQMARFLFPDVLRAGGGTVYTPDEAEEAAYNERLARNASRAAAPAENVDTTSAIRAACANDEWLAQRLSDLFEAVGWPEGKRRLVVANKSIDDLYSLGDELEDEIRRAGNEVPAPPERKEEVVEGQLISDEGDDIEFPADAQTTLS